MTYFGRQRSERAQTFSELADLHVAALAGSNPVDVVSTDRHTVKPWFAGKIPFAFDLPELQNSEFSLVGGRVTYLGQEPGAELIYRFRKHEISVFIFQEGAAGQALPSDSGPQKRVSFTVETWSAGGLRYFVLGDAGAEDIAKLASLFKQAPPPESEHRVWPGSHLFPSSIQSGDAKRVGVHEASRNPRPASDATSHPAGEMFHRGGEVSIRAPYSGNQSSHRGQHVLEVDSVELPDQPARFAEIENAAFSLRSNTRTISRKPAS